MTPVALGSLPSNEPAPTGLVQAQRGAANAQVGVPADGAAFYDGTTNPMQLYITTGSRPGWWIVRGEQIFVIAEGVWQYMAWYIQCSPADADGVSLSYAHHRLHSALSWQQSCIDAVYRLNANTTYSVTMRMAYRQGGTFYYWSGPDYLTLHGEFVAEGSL